MLQILCDLGAKLDIKNKNKDIKTRYNRKLRDWDSGGTILKCLYAYGDSDSNYFKTIQLLQD